MSPIEEESPEAKFPKFGFLYIGTVTDRNDPDGVGRVRINIPGLVDPATDWAFPLGVPLAGVAQRGFFSPPLVGAMVGVLFNQRNIESPFYLSGIWGRPGGVSEVPTNSEIDGDDSGVYPLETKEWLIEIDDKNSVLRATRKSTGDKVELDGVARKATTQVDTTSIVVDGVAKKVTVDADGKFVKVDGVADKVEIDASGKSIIVDGAANKITLDAGTMLLGTSAVEALVKGTAFKTFLDGFLTATYNAHTHIVAAAPGTSAPPIPLATPMPSSNLSTKSKTE